MADADPGIPNTVAPPPTPPTPNYDAVIANLQEQITSLKSNLTDALAALTTKVNTAQSSANAVTTRVDQLDASLGSINMQYARIASQLESDKPTTPASST